MVTVVIVDDHPIVRAGIRAVLGTASDIKILAEGASGGDALRLVEQHHPDVLVLDVSMPDLSGLEVVQRLRAQGSATTVVVLTIHDDTQTVFGLLENGVAGYILKDEDLDKLQGAVRAAAHGEVWLSPTVARRVRFYAKSYKASELCPTPREMEVLRLMGQGLDNDAIAERLVVSKRTVQNHISSIYAKLQVTSRTEAVLLAIRRGWVQVPVDDAQPPGVGGS